MSQVASRMRAARLLLGLLLAINPATRASEDPTATGAEPGVSVSEQSLLNAISQIESRDGAYSAALPEQMLSLGLALQQQERHSEALATFKRGVHLARINNGLYCPEQIPLLKGEIKSAIALGEYGRVDELQEYLYRVQLRGMESGTERAAALVQQANWQFNAYQLGIGELRSERLVSMWDLYRQAWTDISESKGELSPDLLPALHGMLRTQYLISDYRAENENPGSAFSSSALNPSTSQLNAFRSQNYDLGRTIILAIYRIQETSKGADSEEAAAALVALGDWALWNNKRNDATKTYQLALAELAARDGAKPQEARLFAEPVPLPDISGLRRLPPPVSTQQGNILVEFGVDVRGEVVDLVRLDTNTDSDAVAIRLMRRLRNTLFRPRFEAGEPAAMDKLVRAYDIKP